MTYVTPDISLLPYIIAMADQRRRTSETQMADLNAQIGDQNDTLRNMLKVANETNTITNNIQG